MTTHPHAPAPAPTTRRTVFGRTKLVLLLALAALLVFFLVVSWTTRDSMAHLPFLKGQGKARVLADQDTLVDTRPWQTAQALASLAVTAEEVEYARQAEKLADHEVDQAFASALRLASAQVQHKSLSGEALELSQKVKELQTLVKQDQAAVQALTPASAPAASASGGAAQAVANSDDLEIAKAQLGLDTDQLADAQQDLARAVGDQRSRIQEELAEREAAVKKYDSEAHGNTQTAVLSAGQYGTLAGRIRAWMNQRSRYQLIQQALQQANADIAALTAQHNALEAKANSAAASGDDHASRLASLKERAAERQILSIFDDRIQSQQQLADVYRKWSDQVLLQHRIVLHLLLQSLAVIVAILICMVLTDMLLLRLLERPALDRRRKQTLQTILQLGIQVLGILLILLVVFGSPRQMTTILGLATAGLTVVLQDFILAFFGWFVLMGRNGIRVGDWVEINGVGGEVIEINLFRTTMLETGNWTAKGHPTGRRVTFINSFAIRGQYFNFSTTGQWMWDEISVSIPASDNTYEVVEEIHNVIVQETEKSARLAEDEWRRSTRQYGLSQFSADPAINLRPSGAGIDLVIRYITRASERFETRNRLYQRVIDVMHKPAALAVHTGEKVG
ncbi:mechanosensitive ion channel [Terriglobus albidus]|uniref:Mechanosensitive ion channel n=1 Tax=Terriglobus albidus TaxID=1592106 RepID=A0A5B9E7W9_9BACT|nr:mechanosensitive ion channel domain-containing protein [Terriglobus albidus]QEE26720.1 mechanosensitive ion channel [Terriglobus albidus]